eukprot:g305.t1
MADAGLKDSGYIYVNSDDCWMSFNRSSDGSQVPDPQKFPQGFKAVSDFIHNLNMKSGLYTAKGPHTCQKRAASCLHEAQDAKAWASWGIDYVKDDSCSTCAMPNGTKYTDMDDYHRMWQGIQDSGRPMVLTVEGSPPADVITHGGYGNAKRVGHDISPHWSSMISLVDIGAGLWPYAHNSKNSTFGGWWNDLDMIEIGNGGPPAPSPQKPTPPPSPGPKGMWPWAVDPDKAGAGWSMDADGTITNGGLCLTAGGTVSLTACDASKASSQQFTLDAANGNVYLKSQKSSCLALLGGYGPAVTMAQCKQGSEGANEEYTLTGGKLCSKTLGHPPKAVCLKPEDSQPGGGGGGGGGDDGFNCIANAAALARCRVHMSLWTIMKAPLLLGNDIAGVRGRKMDDVALGVVKNKDAISISQDALGVQARRVWTSGSGSSSSGSSSKTSLDLAAGSAAAVAAPCDSSRPTQAWRHGHTTGKALSTTDAAGVEWCLQDVYGTEEVGSWRGVPCASLAATLGTGAGHTALSFQEPPPNAQAGTGVAAGSTAAKVLSTASGSLLAANNAMGASGPIPHTRYIATDQSRSSSADPTWLRQPSSSDGNDDSGPFRLMVADRAGVRNDDKVGGVTFGGDFCLDLVRDGDAEVWAGPLSGSKWAVALLNRNPTATVAITANWTMFNASASTSFAVRDVWQGQDIGTHKGGFTSSVPPQAVTYLLLSPA